MTGRRRARMGMTLLASLALLAGAAWGIASITHSAAPQIIPQCTAGSTDAAQLDTDQTAVAAQMVAEVYQSGIDHPDDAAVLVLAAAMQESKLSNIPPGEGDRDSVGVLQQRPSQGWGSIAGQPDTIADRTTRLTDVTEATREFLLHLDTIDNWWTLAPADAIQEVQVSADGSLYAQHVPLATPFAQALIGTTPAGLTCTFEAPTEVATTGAVIAALKHQLGITTPTASGSTVQVPGAGWQTAAWLVANADQYGIASVSYDAKTWTRTGNWKTSTAPSSAVTATMATVPKN